MTTPGEWADAFIDELKRAGVKGMTLEAAKYETISKLAYDPWKAPAATEVAASGGSGAAPKRPRFDDGSAPVSGPPGQLVGEQAEKKIRDMVAAGKWVEVKAESKRDNTGEYAKYGPHRVVIMKFILDGTERSTFDWKPTLKDAGYFHYSGSDRSGWHPFALPGGKKGQGKEIKDAAELEQYWELKEFDTPKMNAAGDAWVFRGQAFPVASGANEWGPRGSQGPKYGSAWTGD